MFPKWEENSKSKLPMYPTMKQNTNALFISKNQTDVLA